jgi:hypothetical protein
MVIGVAVMTMTITAEPTAEEAMAPMNAGRFPNY